jgi:uncharacterized damage-inducible protein DinB
MPDQPHEPPPAPPWPAPGRPDVPFTGDERSLLVVWLDYHRATLLTKCAGLSADQLVLRSCPPSTLSLLGLVRHLADAERDWFARTLPGRTRAEVPPLNWDDDDHDGDFNRTDPARAGEDLATYLAETRASDEVAARYGLDDTGTMRDGTPVSLRWIYQHLIEEYARHNGHADLLRQAIDGAVGE